jgi:hypothetical protein
MKRAYKSLAAGNTQEAKEDIKFAQSFRRTDEDRQLIGKIESYEKHCRDTDYWLRSGDLVRAEASLAAAKDLVPNGNLAFKLDTSIRDYYTNVKNAEATLTTDLNRAKGYIEAAGRICYTPKVIELRRKAGM